MKALLVGVFCTIAVVAIISVLMSLAPFIAGIMVIGGLLWWYSNKEF